MARRRSFRFLAAAVSGQSHQREQGHWQRSAAHQQSEISIALKMAASTLRQSKTYLGAQFRRFRTRLGAPIAIKAMAAKLARLVYRMLRYGMKYVDQGAAFYELRHRELQIKRLKAKAEKLGYRVTPIPAAA